MGIEHVALGTTTVNTVDLGTLATALARASNHSALRIAFLLGGGHHVKFSPKPGNPISTEPYESEDSKQFFSAIKLSIERLSKDHWTVIPLEPIRQALDTKGLDALQPFPRFVLLGYDYVITTPEAKPAVSLY